jgi:hypothetical protein
MWYEALAGDLGLTVAQFMVLALGVLWLALEVALFCCRAEFSRPTRIARRAQSPERDRRRRGVSAAQARGLYLTFMD